MSDPNEVTEEEEDANPTPPSSPAHQTTDDNPGIIPTPILRTETGGFLLPLSMEVVFYMPFMPWLLVELFSDIEQYECDEFNELVVTCLN